MNSYTREDAKMTQGFAALCMCILHLFCRTGANVLGTPMIWISEEKPLVYWFGFFAEICVPIYTICAGYARQLKIKGTYCDNLERILKLLKNYWIIVILFSAIGLLVGGEMPGSITRFARAMLLLEHYNGAQWYLNSYIILLLLPNWLIMFPVKKMRPFGGIICCFMLHVLWYFVGRFGIWSEIVSGTVGSFFYTELTNLIGVLPYYWIGAFLCKGNLIEDCEKVLEKRFSQKIRNVGLLLIGILFFVVFNVTHKAVMVGIVSLAVFLLFNLLKKGMRCKKFFLFMGKHSTNIWLTHMFFYCADPFNGLVQKAKYPLLMLVFMLVLCITASYIILSIDEIGKRIQKGIIH